MKHKIDRLNKTKRRDANGKFDSYSIMKGNTVN